MSLSEYSIRQIPYQFAMRMIIEKHYLHRKAPCSHAFGLFDSKNNICGVITYGTPSSSALRSGIAGDEEIMNVIELTRLWVDDGVPKNGESFLIGNTVKKINKEIVVSFADTEQNHLGIVYQATNFLYTGLSAKRTDWTVKDIDKHGHTWADKYTAQEMREMFGDRFYLKPRSRKHRYVFINAKGKRKKELLAKLRYPVLPYPKAAIFTE